MFEKLTCAQVAVLIRNCESYEGLFDLYTVHQYSWNSIYNELKKMRWYYNENLNDIQFIYYCIEIGTASLSSNVHREVFQQYITRMAVEKEADRITHRGSIQAGINLDV